MAWLTKNPSTLLRIVPGCALLLTSLLSPTFARSASAREHQIKAAALFNIIAFTEWPERAFASPEAPLVVGVIGQDDTSVLLVDFLTNENWQGRRIVLRKVDSSDEARNCHVLFVASSAYSHWRVIRSQFAVLPILTVSAQENFVRQGGIVQFAIRRNKLQLIVSLAAVQSSGLTISSKLLRLCEIVDERNQ